MEQRWIEFTYSSATTQHNTTTQQTQRNTETYISAVVLGILQVSLPQRMGYATG
jgi:hypothetical protein